eukprot:109813-Rhodomonas_salina.1
MAKSILQQLRRSWVRERRFSDASSARRLSTVQMRMASPSSVTVGKPTVHPLADPGLQRMPDRV